MDAIRPEAFLREHWQKKPLYLRQAVPGGLPSIDQDELAWLATLDDVESRLVFTERRPERTRYTVEHGPFTESELRDLPPADWTLLVNDVEKHLPDLRAWIELVDFIPDWRVDDLMISFAAPGGGVGPHRDNYDVFLCQGIGDREWQYTAGTVEPDPDACDDLALVRPFSANTVSAAPGDMLYLPPGVAHWGTAQTACLTYSIGMRAPRQSDLTRERVVHGADPFYEDPDLQPPEAVPGYISQEAVARARELLGCKFSRQEAADRLGRFVTRPKDWLVPEPTEDDMPLTGIVRLHGMARIAWDDDHVYLNGESRTLSSGERTSVATLCVDRHLDFQTLPDSRGGADNSRLVRWLMRHGAFESRFENA